MNEIHEILNYSDYSTDDLNLIDNLKGDFKNFIIMDSIEIIKNNEIRNQYFSRFEDIRKKLCEEIKKEPENPCNFVLLFFEPWIFSNEQISLSEKLSIVKVKLKNNRYISTICDSFFSENYESIGFTKNSQDQILVTYKIYFEGNSNFTSTEIKLLNEEINITISENNISFVSCISINKLFEDDSYSQILINANKKKKTDIKSKDSDSQGYKDHFIKNNSDSRSISNISNNQQIDSDLNILLMEQNMTLFKEKNDLIEDNIKLRIEITNLTNSFLKSKSDFQEEINKLKIENLKIRSIQKK